MLNLLNKLDKNKDISSIKEQTLHKSIINGKKLVHLLASRGKIDIITKILERFPDYNPYVTDDDGNTLFHHLHSNGYFNMKLLNKYKEALSKINNDNISVLRLSIDSPKTIDKLVHIAPPSAFTQKSRDHTSVTTDLIDKCSDKHTKNQYNKILDNVLKKIDVNDESYLLFYCIEKNNHEIFIKLMESVTDPNIKNSHALSLLSCATMFDRYEFVRTLLDKPDIDINSPGPENKFIPINTALYNRNNDIMRLLLSKNVNVDIKDRYHNTVLHNILLEWNMNDIPIDIICDVIARGDINAKNFSDETPLHIMTKKNQLKFFINIINNKDPDVLSPDINGDNIFSHRDVQNVESLLAIKYTLKPTDISKNISDINNNANSGLFNSDIIHSMIYTLQFIKKYPDLAILFQPSNKDKQRLDTWRLNMYKNNLIQFQDSLWNLVDLYNNMFYNILPHVIIWRRGDLHYIDKNFVFHAKKTLSGPRRFLMIKLTVFPNQFSTHANTIIYDKKLKKVVRFEPYGVDDIVDGDELDKKIKMIFTEIDGDITYIRPSDFLSEINWQTISHDSDIDEKLLGDPQGYCLAWCYWFIECKLKNPELDEKELMTQEFNKINKIDKSLGNPYLIHIRSYSAQLDNMKNEFMSEVGIPHIAKYQTSYENKYLNMILNNIKSVLKECLTYS
jgi:ankyrin repeat protein